MTNPYDFTPALKEKIFAKIKQIAITPGSGHLRCPACGHWEWEMADGFATVPLLKNFWTGERASSMPSAALVCTKCGNTLFFNLGTLGFALDIALDIAPDMEEMRKKWGLK